MWDTVNWACLNHEMAKSSLFILSLVLWGVIFFLEFKFKIGLCYLLSKRACPQVPDKLENNQWKKLSCLTPCAIQ